MMDSWEEVPTKEKDIADSSTYTNTNTTNVECPLPKQKHEKENKRIQCYFFPPGCNPEIIVVSSKQQH